MISLVRVDNRLIHGQVVEAWLPHLKVSRVVVADDEAAGSPLVRAAMALAISSNVEVQIEPLEKVDFAKIAADSVKTLLLVREVGAVLNASLHGLPLSRLNLGNVHFASGRRKVSASVFLSPDELNQLKMLADKGAEIEVRAVPSDKPVTLAEISERFDKGA